MFTAPRTCIPLSEEVSLSFRCFVCRQSRQQLEEEQKKSLYGLENTGNVSCADARCSLRVRVLRVGICLLSLPTFPFSGLAPHSRLVFSLRQEQMVAGCQTSGKRGCRNAHVTVSQVIASSLEWGQQ